MEVHGVGMLVYDLQNAHPVKIASWIRACKTPSQFVGQGGPSLKPPITFEFKLWKSR